MLGKRTDTTKGVSRWLARDNRHNSTIEQVFSTWSAQGYLSQADRRSVTVEVEVLLQLMVSQSVSQYVLALSPLWDLQPILFEFCCLVSVGHPP
jgi:hypothetical protein